MGGSQAAPVAGGRESPRRGACRPGGCHPRCLDSLPAFSEEETELRWAFQIWGAEVDIAESVDGAAGLGEATEKQDDVVGRGHFATQDDPASCLHLLVLFVLASYL